MCVEHIRPSCGPALDSSDIQLMAMHGSMLQDASRVSRVLQLPLPSSAFAFTAEGDPDPAVAGLPDKLPEIVAPDA